MFSNEHDRVLEALDVLCNVPKETLQSLRSQVPLAFQKLQALVGNSSLLQDTNRFSPSVEAQGSSTSFSNPQSPSSAVSNITDTSSSALNTQASTSSTDISSSSPSADGHSLPKSISSLIEVLNKSSVQIKDFLSRSEFEDTSDELQRMIEDPRVVDLQLDKRRLSDKVRFRKAARQEHAKKDQARQLNAFFKIKPDTGSSYVQHGGFHTGQLLEALNQRTEADMDRYACSEAVDCMEAYFKVGTRRQSPSKDVRYQDRSQEHPKNPTAIRRTV